ncbi:MAG: hypothetical protein ACK2UW_08590 [Anaerolineales bacterium]|jgi:hypothetical protein
MNQETEFVLWRAQQQVLLDFCLRESGLSARQAQLDEDPPGVRGAVRRLVRWMRLAEPRVGVLNFSDFEDWQSS